MILHGKDDVGIQKSGFLWKQTKHSFKPWKQYYFVLTRLCLICYHRGSNGIQGKHPKLKIDLSDVTRVEVGQKEAGGGRGGNGKQRVAVGGKKYAGRQFSVWYGGKKSRLVVRCEAEEETQEWVAALQDWNVLCSNRKKVHQELRRASFKLHVEQNVRSKVIIGNADHSKELPKVTYLNRTPWDERMRSVSVDSKLNSFPNKTYPPGHLSITPEKRCYTYNENIVLSTPDIPLAQIHEQSQRFSSPPAIHHHQLDLSKSFSSDDMRVVGVKNPFRLQPGSGSCQRAEDADSGQGSEDSNVFSEGQGQDGNLLNITGETSEGGQDSSSVGWLPRPGRIQWLKDRDIPKDTRDPEIVFNPAGTSSPRKVLGERYYSKGQHGTPSNRVSYKQQTTTPTTSYWGSSGKLHRGKWSSDLDLVPEGKEVSLFRTREHGDCWAKERGEFQQQQPDRKDHSSSASRISDYNYMQQQQQLLRNQTSGNAQPTKPYGLRRYHLQDGTYTVMTSQQDLAVDQSGQYQDKGLVNCPRSRTSDQGSFERQNKLYRSLDSAISPHGYRSPGGTTTTLECRHGSRDSQIQRPARPTMHRMSEERSAANYITRNGHENSERRSVDVNFSRDDSSSRQQHHSNKSCHWDGTPSQSRGQQVPIHSSKYHNYEEAETDFSGPDEGGEGSEEEGVQQQQYYRGIGGGAVSRVTTEKTLGGGESCVEGGSSSRDKKRGAGCRHGDKGRGSAGGLSRGAQDVRYSKHVKGLTQQRGDTKYRCGGGEGEGREEGEYQKEQTVYYV